MRVDNRKARFDYDLLERFETGIVLKGSEAKAIREGRADLSRAVVKIINNEAFLINCVIPGVGESFEKARSRKLLIHKKEIYSLETKAKQQKLTLVPLALYNKGRLVKLEVALGKPKRKFEKREVIKKRDIERELGRDFKLK